MIKEPNLAKEFSPLPITMGHASLAIEETKTKKNLAISLTLPVI
jgi:hypothetical protein